LTDEEEEEERPCLDEYLHGIVSHVNEYDEKLKNLFTKEEDHRTILIIGGIKVFLPSSRGETNIDVAGEIEGQQAETVMKEDEQMLKSIPTEEECPVELLTQWELELKELEDWFYSLELEGGFHKIAMP
jgi:hypothetical protein